MGACPGAGRPPAHGSGREAVSGRRGFPAEAGGRPLFPAALFLFPASSSGLLNSDQLVKQLPLSGLIGEPKGDRSSC